MNTKKEHVEGIKRLRKQSGLPYLNEAEILEKYGFEEEVTESAEEDLDEASKEELLKRFGKNKKTFKKDGDDADSDAEVVDADDEDEEKDGKKKKEEGKKKSSRNDEAITKQKLDGNKRSGVDAKVHMGDKKLTNVVGDKDDKKAAAVKPVGDDVKATVEAITPDKLAADKLAGADAEVVIPDRDLLPQAKFVEAVQGMVEGCMHESVNEESHAKMTETLTKVAEAVNDMLKASFDGPQVRREALRDTVNKSEIRKEAMVHETKGESRLGEKLDDAKSMYEADVDDMVASIEQANGELIAKLSEGKY